MILRPRACTLLPLCFVTGSLGAWLAACGPEGATPEHVRKSAEKLDAYCTAPVTGSGTLDVETDYLPHVVHCENGGAPYESLKAQAVAARSFLYYKMETAGSIGDGQGDQVYSCGSGPSQQQIDAVKETSGQFLSYQGVVICAFYVAGSKQTPPACKGVNDVATEKYVTYNWGLSGDGIDQSSLGWVSASNKRNRGCMSQWGSRCLADDGWVYGDILKFYYGMDIVLETATGPCITQQNTPPKGYLDGADCTSVHGWAQDPDEPTKAIDVHVSFDAPAGDPAAKTITVNAGIDRQDLCGPLGSCNHGYELKIPLSLRDGAAHAVYVEAVDTAGGGAAALQGSPGQFTCKVTPPLSASQGVRRPIPSMDIFAAWKFSSLMDVAKLSDAELEAYPIGPDLPATPALARGDDGTPEVWLLDTGARRHVPSPAVMAAWRFDAAAIQSMAAAKLNALPKAVDVRAEPFLMQGTDPAVWVLDDPINGSGTDGGSAGSGGSSTAKDSGVDASAGKPGGSLYSKTPSDDSGCSCGVSAEPRDAVWFALAGFFAMGLMRRRSRERERAGTTATS
jgi:MYXO-CTERM domain-containing protein